MSLVQSNRKALTDVKELARAGEWQSAMDLIETLPSTSDTDRLKKQIAKKLYLETGEIPSVDGIKVVDSQTTAAVAQEAHKEKRSKDKGSRNIVNAILNFFQG